MAGAEPSFLLTVESIGAEARNPADSGVRWCSVVLLGRTRVEDAQSVNDALGAALKNDLLQAGAGGHL